HDGKNIPSASLFAGMRFGADFPDLSAPVANWLYARWMDEAFPWDLPLSQTGGARLALPKVTLPKKNGGKGLDAVYEYGGLSNPSGATFAYTPKTGLFKGTFKLYYDGYNTGNALQHKAVSVPYSGVMVPVREGVFNGIGAGVATLNRVKTSIPVHVR
ncbi:MAG: hypothetical protein FWF96_02180, partial [Kiritimatiellaeota bacterium]|nr:hypothetical protein [Kiritimatiellota bacterium]